MISSFFLFMKLDLFSGLTFVFLILHLTRYINLLPTSSLRLGTLSPTHAEHRNNVNYVHWTDCSFLNMEALRPEIHDDIFPSGFHCDDLKLLRNPCAEKWNLEGCENCEKWFSMLWISDNHFFDFTSANTHNLHTKHNGRRRRRTRYTVHAIRSSKDHPKTATLVAFSFWLWYSAVVESVCAFSQFPLFGVFIVFPLFQ